jgi:hypothetical protein
MAARTECHAAPIPLKFGGAIDTTMSTIGGQACTLMTHIGSASVEDIVVETSPRFGSVTPRGRSGIIYRPQPAYAGNDYFAVELKGRANSETGAMKLRVAVTVR